ncbi:MAG: methionine synthase [Methanobacteriaceae archaeon]|nr:methionine synthase [Methanobacteriaceae archaeon]
MNVITSVVGSFPVIDSYPKGTINKFKDFLGIYKNYEYSIKKAVKCQTTCNLDLITDGQVRGSMIDIFCKPINGIDIIDNNAFIKGRIMPAHNYKNISDDFKTCFKSASSIDNKFKLNADKDELFDHTAKGIKGLVTGPTTLINSSVIDGFYESKEDAIYDMAVAIHEYVVYLEELGASMIQIDDPFIALGVTDISISKDSIDIITEDITIPIGIHICGDLKENMGDVLDFNLDFFDFEFAGVSGNIDTLQMNKNKIGDSMISIGCIDTKLKEIDNKETVFNTVKKVTDIINNKNIIIDPDCGMRLLDYNLVYNKLQLLNSTAKKFEV